MSSHHAPNFMMCVACTILLIVGMASAQPDTLWTAQIQESGNPIFYDAAPLSSGGFVLSGETNPGFTTSNMLFSKIAEDGEVDWTRSFGPAGADAAYAVAELADGTLISVGCLNTSNLIILGISPSGDSLWSRTYSSGGFTCLNNLAIRSDGVITAVGTGLGSDGVHSDVLLAKYDPVDDTLTVWMFGSDASESGLTLTLKPDNGFVVAGTTNGFGSTDANIWLLDVDANGTEISSSVVRHTGADVPSSMTRVGSEIFLCGRSTVSNQNRGFAVKTNEQFDTLWTREFSGSNAEVQFRGLANSNSGDVIAAGWSGTSWNARQCWLTAISPDGSASWEWLHGTAGSGFYGVLGVQAGGYLAFGQLVVGNSRRAYAARVFLSKLTGTVVDHSNGNPVAGARVSASDQDNFTTTDSEGRFTLTASNGIHDVYVARHCFSKDTIEALEIAADETLEINVSLLTPDVAVSRTSINVIAPDQEPITVPFTITNPADGYLEVQITAVSISPETDWLSVTPESAVLSAGDSVAVTVQISPGNNAPENFDFTGSVILYSNACPRDTLDIPVFALLLDAEAPASIPDQLTLSSSPNPFNSITNLQFSLPKSANIDLSVYSITGQFVSTLSSGMFPAGSHEVSFDASGLASGSYFVKLAEGDHVLVTKVVLLK